MADVFDAEKRSDVMSRIRSRGTEAEKIVFRYLRQQKVYFQKHYAKAPGKPDLALPRKRKAVFIDGDFWHGRTLERVRQNHAPDSYWVRKIVRNMERDEEQRSELQSKGWQIKVVWEKDLKRKRTRAETLEAIADFLRS